MSDLLINTEHGVIVDADMAYYIERGNDDFCIEFFDWYAMRHVFVWLIYGQAQTLAATIRPQWKTGGRLEVS